MPTVVLGLHLPKLIAQAIPSAFELAPFTSLNRFYKSGSHRN
jgi:hypothetical protein